MKPKFRIYKGPTLEIPNVFLYRLENASTGSQRVRISKVHPIKGSLDSRNILLNLKAYRGLLVCNILDRSQAVPKSAFVLPHLILKRAEICPQP